MDNGAPMRKGEYLLDEEIWIECGNSIHDYFCKYVCILPNVENVRDDCILFISNIPI